MDGIFAPYRYKQLNITSLGVGDLVGHRLGTRGVGNYIAYICLVTVQCWMIWMAILTREALARDFMRALYY
jgi:hypothetical protein